jgi:predicted RNA-binding Zn-ribbon protein involved in translation (DUF1610 family)
MVDCPDCGTEMVYKFSIRSNPNVHVTRVYQCPKCKTIDSKLEEVEIDG